jgi:hypothetical protein
MCDTLSAILEAFQGLRDLFIALPGPGSDLRPVAHYAHHKLTLTRFVCHQRTVNLNEYSPHLEEEMDILDLSLLPGDRAKLDRPESDYPFAGLNLECIGLGCTPRLLV